MATHCWIEFSFWVVLPIDDCIHPAHTFHLTGFSFRVIFLNLSLSQIIHKALLIGSMVSEEKIKM
jgi:hypothetical protein